MDSKPSSPKHRARASPRRRRCCGSTSPPSAVLVSRDLRRFFRQMSRVVGALVQPLIFWLVIGSGLASSFRMPGAERRRLRAVLLSRHRHAGGAVHLDLHDDVGDRRSPQRLPAGGAGRAGLARRAGARQDARRRGHRARAGGDLPRAGAAGRLRRARDRLAASWRAARCSSAIGLSSMGFAIAWWLDSTQGYHVVMSVLLHPAVDPLGRDVPDDRRPTWIGWSSRAPTRWPTRSPACAARSTAARRPASASTTAALELGGHRGVRARRRARRGARVQPSRRQAVKRALAHRASPSSPSARPPPSRMLRAPHAPSCRATAQVPAFTLADAAGQPFGTAQLDGNVVGRRLHLHHLPRDLPAHDRGDVAAADVARQPRARRARAPGLGQRRSRSRHARAAARVRRAVPRAARHVDLRHRLAAGDRGRGGARLQDRRQPREGRLARTASPSCTAPSSCSSTASGRSAATTTPATAPSMAKLRDDVAALADGSAR